MSTDIAWEEWGRRDPYFGVITNPKFRRSELNDHSKREFFESGQSHAHGVLTTIRRFIDPGFAPRTVLDFGCGVGRLLIPFAKVADEVVGLDVSPSMLKEARRNCDEHGLSNIRLLDSDDSLSTVTGTFDLIHSCIVFQHIPPERGRAIFFETSTPFTARRCWCRSVDLFQGALRLDAWNRTAPGSAIARCLRSIESNRRRS